MSILLLLMVLFLCAFGYSFLYWVRLREDYSGDVIFTCFFLSVALAAVFSIFLSWLLKGVGWVYWGVLLGILVGVVIGNIRFRMRFFEGLEAAILGILVLNILVFAYFSISNFSVFTVLMAASAIVWLLVFFLLDRRYKNFSWYRSGKIGFSGLSSLGGFYLTSSLIALLVPTMVFFTSQIDVIISGIISFLSFLAIYNLSRQ